jgi:hypothetical protein
LKSLQ